MSYLSDMFGGQDMSSIFGDYGSSAFNSAAGMANALGGLQSNFKQGSINTGLNNQINGSLTNNTSDLQNQLATLQQQQQMQQQQAQDQYNSARGNVNQSNQQLQGTIGTETTNLNNLTDPNSPYMQMAQRQIEAKDAAAGRNSQWGDRAVQLAGTLAQTVAQNSPGMLNSINNAQNQINLNNQGLATLFGNAYKPAQTSQQDMINAIQQSISNANAQNTNGRQAATAANNTNSLSTLGSSLGGVGKLLGSLSGMFGGNSNSTAQPWGSAVNGINSNPYDTTADTTLMNTPEADMGMAGYAMGLAPADPSLWQED